MRALLLTLALAACSAETRFVRTDDSWAAPPASQAPRVYFDALPETPYRAVGIISVVIDVLAGRGAIAAAAAEAGQRAGCLVLVERKLHESRGPRSELEVPLILVHDGGPTHADSSNGGATRKIDFVCGAAPRAGTGA
jgi:hypothetical protein